jgi:hypothetical protein
MTLTWIHSTGGNEAAGVDQARDKPWRGHNNDISDQNDQITDDGEQTAFASFVREVPNRNTCYCRGGIDGDCEELSPCS